MITAIKNNITIKCMLIGAACTGIAAILFLLVDEISYLLIYGTSYGFAFVVKLFLILFFTVIPGTFAAMFLSIIFRVFYAKLSMTRAILLGAAVGFLLGLCMVGLVYRLTFYRIPMVDLLYYFSLSSVFSVITAGWVARLIFKVIARSRANLALPV